MKKCWFLCGLFFWMMPVLGQDDVVYIDIGGASSRTFRLAVPVFVAGDGYTGNPQILKDMTSYFVNLFTFTKSFEYLEPETYFQKEAPVQWNIDYKPWKTIKADAVFYGRLGMEGSQFKLDMAYYDIAKETRVLAKSFYPLSQKGIEFALRRFADQFMEARTGTLGSFSSKIVFVGSKNPGEAKQVFMSFPDGSDLVPLTSGKDIHISPSWSPDGMKVSYTSFETGRPEVFVKDLRTKKKFRLTHRKEGIASGSTWHPQGRFLAYSESENESTRIVSVSSVDGGGKSILVKGEGLEVEPDYSPDGQFLAFTSGRFGRPHLFVKNLSTLEEKRLTFQGWYNTSPSWRPDAKKIAFAAYDRDIDRYDIMMINPDGSSMERLTLKQGDNEKPSWAPDGRFILFQSNRSPVNQNVKQKNYKLYMMDKDGLRQFVVPIPLYDVQMVEWGPSLSLEDLVLLSER